ncbi:hypothetical protein [Conexibacter sp. SYSU D00693]|uniref:hypothetical protein n=1 Tax=Conexibacter sp. SYSU D00693 TaxID=2812560 RepID=UPI00196B79CD|nr:hypothetical protein [Conexibacter sp. SYSU D00693]
MSRRLLAAVVALVLGAAAPAGAQLPIPEVTRGSAPVYVGAAVEPRPFDGAFAVPRHPHMAPNGRSNLHEDAFQTDTVAPGRVAPLGDGTRRTASRLFVQECASITFDSRGQAVTVCVGLAQPTLRVLDPVTLEERAALDLPPRNPLAGTGNPLTSFGGGGYFFLDDRDRAVIPTADRHVRVVQVGPEPSLRQVADVALTSAVADGDSVISALPDWSGRIWFATSRGVVGTVDLASGTVRATPTGEGIGNSFAVDRDGSVSLVTDAALYRFEAGDDGVPRAVWRLAYDDVGVVKPGQTQAGSGTTPTLMGEDLVAFTDNADPMHVVVAQRGREADGERVVCRQPVFRPGASATDQSLIVAGRTIVVENNHGYQLASSLAGGSSAAPGLARVDLDEDGRGCRVVWTSEERAPSVVPKLSLETGLVYTYTKDQGSDAWYLTALDVRDGSTRWKALGGASLGFNNNYAPITVAPDGAILLGVLGGVVRFADARPPHLAPRPAPSRGSAQRAPLLSARCLPRGRVRLAVRSPGVRRATFTAGRRTRTVRARPYAVTLPRAARVAVRVLRRSGAVRRASRRLRC